MAKVLNNMTKYKYTIEDAEKFLNETNQNNAPIKYTLEDAEKFLNSPEPNLKGVEIDTFNNAPQDELSFLEKAEPYMDKFYNVAGALGSGIKSGYLAGFDDEAEARIASILPHITYKQALQVARERKKARNAQNPALTTVGNVVGEVVSPLSKLAFNKVKNMKGASKLQKMKAVAPTVAAQGALSGYGYSEEEDLTEQLKDTAQGAATGLALLPAFTAGESIVGAAYRASKKLGKGIKNSIFGAGDKGSKDYITERLDIDPKEAYTKLTEAKNLGLKTSLSEVVEPDSEIMTLVTSLASNPKNKKLIANNLDGRAKESVKRVVGFLNNDVSNKNYYDNIDLLKQKMQEKATPLYDKAFEKGLKLDLSNKENLELFNKIAPDLKDARKKFRIGEEVEDNSLEMIDNAKKALDDKIGKAITQNEKQEARVLQKIKTELLKKVDSLNPEYAEARKIYTGEARLLEAQEQGKKFLQGSSDDLNEVGGLGAKDLKRAFKDFSQSERDAYKIGAKKAIMDRFKQTPQGANPVGRSRLLTDFQKEKLQLILNKDEYSKFIKKLQLEDQLFQARNKALRGSPTAERLQGQASNAAISGMVSQEGLATKVLNFTGKFIQSRWSGINEANAKKIAEFLTNRDKSFEFLDDLIKKNSQEQRLIIKDALNDLLSVAPATRATTQQINQANGEQENNN